MTGALDHWILFPVGVVVATLATSSGLAGSNFWIPIYLRWLELEPRLVFWMSLVTMTFGFGSGVVRNLLDGTVDWGLVRRYGRVAVPVAALASLGAARAPQNLLLGLFAVFALVHGVVLLAGAVTPGRAVALPWLGAALAAGTSQGLIATGAGTFSLPSMLAEARGHHARAVGAAVLLVFASTLAAVAFRLDSDLVAALRAGRSELMAMVAFAGPGVVVGGQLGPRLAGRIPQSMARPYVGALLLLVAALVASRLF